MLSLNMFTQCIPKMTIKNFLVLEYTPVQLLYVWHLCTSTYIFSLWGPVQFWVLTAVLGLWHLHGLSAWQSQRDCIFRWIYEMSSFRCWSFWDVTVALFYHSSIADAISDGVQICCSLLQVLLDSFCWMFRHTVVPVHRNGTQSGWGLTKWLTKPNGLVLGEGETSLHLSFPPATWSLPILGCVILVNWMSSRSPNDQSHCQERDVTTWPSLEDSDYFSSWHQSGVDQL